MKNTVYLLIAVFFWSSFADNRIYCQQNAEPDILEIRELYRKAQEYITLQSKAGAAKNQVQVTTQKSWLGRGWQRKSDRRLQFLFLHKEWSLGQRR